MKGRATYWFSGAVPLIAPELLGGIIATASDIAIVITPEGRILSLLTNPNHTSFGQLDHWQGRDIREFLTTESVPKLEARLATFAEGGDEALSVELNHTDNAVWEFPIRYTLHRIGPDGAILLLGRDLRPIAEMQQQLVRAQLALESDYEVQREYDTRFRVLMDVTTDPVFFVALSRGRISDLNVRAAELFGADREELLDRPLSRVLDGRSQAELVERLTQAAAPGGGGRLQVQLPRARRPVTVVARLFRAAGEKFLACRVESGAAAAAAAEDEFTRALREFFESGAEAIVFTDSAGIIQSANESFLALTDAPELATVKGRSLAEYLVRGGADLKVLTESAARAGRMRMYATRLVSEFGAQISVEVSATRLDHERHQAFAFVIRDASRAEAVRRPAAGPPDTELRGVVGMVGSATLKDIVADTTDAVEKMCIETAIELTRNNRVAAAEMLGLSRQSLYVKLRKFDLLNKGAEE